MALEQVYPGVAFRRRTRNWWARLTRVPAECVHLETEQLWMATLVPDTVYLRGKPARRHEPERPEVSLCRNCLLRVLEAELARYHGRVVAFEPDAEIFSQYFFVAPGDFEAAGLLPEVASAIVRRLGDPASGCRECGEVATWLWVARDEVNSLDETGRIAAATGRCLCPLHGARKLAERLGAIEQANLFYMNLPYGSSGAYLWI